uniref:Uncharacterized protein n=1 Tax=Amphimedon queenslandica TaxID=400682 RepID=A0A1X7SKS5_AMPQE
MVILGHFEPNSARGRYLLPGKYPTLKLPEKAKAEKQHRPPIKRVTVPLHENHDSADHHSEEQR